MIKSMTGYGKAEVLLESGKVTVEIRSLNGKTADISLKTSLLPKDKEIAVRQKIATELQRGNIDMFMSLCRNTTEYPIVPIIHNPEASPSIPSIRFMELMIRTATTIVNGIPMSG